ncbi:MAG: hypothetical protein BGO86_04560 [Chryseobacterium sp. 36-9]|nr:MAG: hypothetical protein BGO86_04560 [Chryseobacterium sp. 36-9]
MNRKLWERKSFESDFFGNYICPRCFTGTLIKRDKISKITATGIDSEKHGYPYGIEHLFSGILECNNQECKDVVSLNGILRTDISHGYEQPDGQWVEVKFNDYEPKFFLPNLRMFDIRNKNIPKEIRNQVDSAFSQYFLDETICANKIRTAIELILDHLKAPKRKLNKSKKLVRLRTLHDRIENYKKTKPQVCKLLLALKIIGNEGSHTSIVKNEDILDAFEILEQILDDLFIKNRKRIISLADKIITK